MRNKPKTVVITGAEYTGKITLSNALSAHFSAPVVPEYTRKYIENLDRDYNYEDVEFIAKMQIEELGMILNTESPLIILDIWLLITKVWFQIVFKKVPIWLHEKIRSTRVDLF